MILVYLSAEWWLMMADDGRLVHCDTFSDCDVSDSHPRFNLLASAKMKRTITHTHTSTHPSLLYSHPLFQEMPSWDLLSFRCPAIDIYEASVTPTFPHIHWTNFCGQVPVACSFMEADRTPVSCTWWHQHRSFTPMISWFHVSMKVMNSDIMILVFLLVNHDLTN